MAAGDINKKTGKPSDIVRHFSSIDGGLPACKTKGFGYSTNDPSDVTCKRCQARRLKINPQAK